MSASPGPTTRPDEAEVRPLMLRRKLLIVFGSLVIVLAGIGVTATWMIQSAARDLGHIHDEIMGVAAHSSELSTALTTIEIDLYELQLGRTRHLDKLIDDVATAERLVRDLGGHSTVREAGADVLYRDLVGQFPQFRSHVGSLAVAKDAAMARRLNVEALGMAVGLRDNIRRIDGHVGRYARREQSALADRFRRLVLAVAIGGALAINVAIIVLLRAAGMVLGPVEKLVEASRRLTRKEFDYRALLDGDDEFSELATGYNSLAERLQTGEKREIETLGQLALTLNHELNNVVAMIELQLQFLDHQTGDNGALKIRLRQIRRNLERIVRTMESIKHIRRVVLTDYVAGVKMLDLERSVETGQDEHHPAVTGARRDGQGP